MKTAAFIHRPMLGAMAALTISGLTWAVDLPGRQTLNAHGVKISYAVQGSGEPVLLIHGWLSSAVINWDLPGTTSALAKKYKVITFDVPGHGQSDAPTDEAAYGPELVADTVRLLDNLIQCLYVEPLRSARPDWQVIEIPDANHLTCIAKPESREQIFAWLDQNAK